MYSEGVDVDVDDEIEERSGAAVHMQKSREFIISVQH